MVLRQSCIYGRRQFGVEDQGWVAHFAIRSFFKRPVTIYGDGRQVRDVLFVDVLVLYLTSASTSNQVVWYTVPVVPFTAIFASLLFVRLLREKFVPLKAASYAALVLVFAYTAVYSAANVLLYTGKNVREETSEWIENNIPKGASIAIARNYFWTPPVLRQYNPPYEIIEGGDIQSTPDIYISGLRPAAKKAKYCVISEFEYRNYYHPKLKALFPAEYRVFEEIMDGNIWKKIAEFNKEAVFLGIKFGKNYPPGDWLLPNPKILVYKQINNG